MAVPVGTLLSGRYRLDAVVGTGGMSTVFRAFDIVLEREVAIKLMHREVATNADQLERFRREARSVAQLNDPYVVGVIDAGEDDGTPYIVFEFIAGETLKERIRRNGRLAVPEAVAYAIEICRALEAAHAASIVHRDVKPQNVLVDEEGTARVTDFGIARALDEDALTAHGRVLGTTDYVSPEQALGHPVTPQSDLYSLGVVLYEMLTGQVPFTGETPVAVAMRHVREELPDLQQRRPEISSVLAAVVDRATAKELERRHASAAELIADLEEVLAIEAVRSGHAGGEATAVLRSLPARERQRLPLRMRTRPAVAVAALLLTVAAVVAIVVLAADKTTRGTGPSAGPAAPRTAGTSFVRLATDAVHDFDPLGDGHEHREQADVAVDRIPGTAWSTENYSDALAAVKRGVGLYVDAAPQVRGARLDILTPTPGWRGAIYGAPAGPAPASAPPAGWTRLATIGAAVRKTSTRLRSSRPYRYYLIWITALPADARAVKIAEVDLYRRAG